MARLTGPDGWLTVVGLHWLEPGATSVGSHPRSALRLPADRAPERVGTIDVEEGQVWFEPEPEAPVDHDGHRVMSRLRLRDDLEGAGAPTVLAVGSLRLHVIRRFEDRLGVRVRDLEGPARQRFTGIEHYPVDERWRLQARFEPYDPPKVSRAPTVLGMEEAYPTPGALAFDHDGRTHRLDAFLEPGETDLFIVFADATSGTETYGGGRYLYTKQPDGAGLVELDFNRAYNPPCVFTAHATCALPLPQNRLPFRVEAGEKRYDG
jgi:uncharacterized protein